MALAGLTFAVWLQLVILLPQCLQGWVTGMHHYSQLHFHLTFIDTGVNVTALL